MIFVSVVIHFKTVESVTSQSVTPIIEISNNLWMLSFLGEVWCGITDWHREVHLSDIVCCFVFVLLTNDNSKMFEPRQHVLLWVQHFLCWFFNVPMRLFGEHSWGRRHKTAVTDSKGGASRVAAASTATATSVNLINCNVKDADSLARSITLRIRDPPGRRRAHWMI